MSLPFGLLVCNHKCFDHIFKLYSHFNFKEKPLEIVQLGRNFHFHSIIGPYIHRNCHFHSKIGPNFHLALTTNGMY